VHKGERWEPTYPRACRLKSDYWSSAQMNYYMQIRLPIDKYEIVLEDGKIYLCDNETQEAMEIEPKRIINFIKKEFKRVERLE